MIRARSRGRAVSPGGAARRRRDGAGVPGPLPQRPAGGGETVRPELAGDTRFRRRFADEVAAAELVGGFFTAPVVDADTDANPPWLVTAYIEGPSLYDAVEKHGPLPLGARRPRSGRPGRGSERDPLPRRAPRPQTEQREYQVVGHIQCTRPGQGQLPNSGTHHRDDLLWLRVFGSAREVARFLHTDRRTSKTVSLYDLGYDECDRLMTTER
ncbi:MAG: hypothetical protein ACRDNL_09015 [Spirillospora sp.]